MNEAALLAEMRRIVREEISALVPHLGGRLPPSDVRLVDALGDVFGTQPFASREVVAVVSQVNLGPARPALAEALSDAVPVLTPAAIGSRLATIARNGGAGTRWRLEPLKTDAGSRQWALLPLSPPRSPAAGFA